MQEALPAFSGILVKRVLRRRKVSLTTSVFLELRGERKVEKQCGRQRMNKWPSLLGDMRRKMNGAGCWPKVP
jgi:hypothetical protein